MNKPRQFAIAVLVCACTLQTACQARSTPDALQTAIGIAQAAATAIPDTKGLLPGLEVLLAGVQLEVNTSPEGAAKENVTEVTIRGTDTSGTLGQLDARARQAAAGAALVAASQYYPSARLSLTIVDNAGGTLVTATKAAGSAPEFQ